jgi:16S rRNA (adenine1518-N6/adenine1519-N6)-dimethyltransferase
MNRREIMDILASAGLRPQNQFGQNFMIDQNILTAIADAGAVQPGDVVLEVGPGVGNLTRLLAQRAHQGAVLAVEIDRKLMPAAAQHHATLTNVHWLNADVLAGKHEINPEVVAQLKSLHKLHPHSAVRLVSNLPYNAASPLVAELLVLMWQQEQQCRGADAPLRFARLAFTVQWEVAERMRAGPGTRDYGPLGILIQLLAKVQVVRKIPAGAFWPPPKINSALVVIEPLETGHIHIQDAIKLQRLLAGIFSHRRQKLLNGLKHYLGDQFTPDLPPRLAAAGIDVALRPENLSPAQFVTLADCLAL